jgi:hypothetical protein
MQSSVLNILWIDELRVIVALSSEFLVIHVQSGAMQTVLSFQGGLFSWILPSARSANKPLLCLINDTGVLLTRESKSPLLNT